MRLLPRTLRGRLTLVFAAGTAVLCLLVGVLVDVQYRQALRNALDDGLATRFDELKGKLKVSTTSRVQPALPDDESLAQVVDGSGKIAAAAPKALLHQLVLSRSELSSALHGQITRERRSPPRDERSRLLAGPAGSSRRRYVVVVGSSLAEAIHAEHRLTLALLVGLPLLAAVVSLGGWVVTGAALTPVRDLIEEADAVSAIASRGRGRRLSVPRGGEELAELTRGLNELLARIEAALDHERAFLDDASHELRTPISITRSELELARMQAPENSEVASALDSALEEVDRLDRLAVSLLVLARTRSAGPPPRDPVDLDAVARRAAGIVTRSRRSDSLAIEVHGSATVPGDEAALERAVVNLLDNATRHARHRVDVEVESERDAALVIVSDDGPGFPPELVHEAAGRFVRGPNPSQGAGLGLAIVDAIAAAHAGTLEIVDQPDGWGARVRLRLPRSRSA